MRVTLVHMIAAIVPAWLSAQDPVPFITGEDRFMIFADGRFEKIEPRPPRQVWAMTEQVVYLDHEGRLKGFFVDGRRLHLLQAEGVGEVQATRERIAWRSRDTLKTLREGRAVMLATNVEAFSVSDSLVVLHDSAHHEIDVIWRGRIIPLAMVERGSERPQWTQASNVVTFFNKGSRTVFIFHRGAVRPLCDSTDLGVVSVGSDLAAYWDGNRREFRAMHQGRDHFLADLRPMSVKAGDGILGFVDGTGVLKCFANGSVHTLSATIPSGYWVQDSLLMYLDEGRLQLFRPEGPITVENYVPERWQVHGGDLVYLDINRELRGIVDGERVRFGSEANVPTFDLFGRSVHYRSPTGMTTIIRNGRAYTF